MRGLGCDNVVGAGREGDPAAKLLQPAP